MKVGNLVKLAHHGTLAHKEEFEKYVVNKWGVGLITRVLPGGHLDQYDSPVDWIQAEVLWSSRGILKIEDVEAIEVIS